VDRLEAIDNLTTSSCPKENSMSNTNLSNPLVHRKVRAEKKYGNQKSFFGIERKEKKKLVWLELQTIAGKKEEKDCECWRDY
jgi:hypothetical protein